MCALLRGALLSAVRRTPCRARHVRGAAIGARLALFAGTARAEDPPPAAQAGAPAGTADAAPDDDPADPSREMDAPGLLSGTIPPYPEGETREGVVRLSLLVGPDGSVREVRRARGDPPFVDLARDAALSWQFERPLRGLTPVSVIVDMELVFTPPAKGPDTPPPPDEPRVEEVVVRGDRREPPRRPLGRTEIRMLPGAFGDPMRSIEILPGVSPTVSGLPYFYIRGAPPNATAFYLDDLRLPYLFHVGLGPSNVHPAWIRSVDLYPAGTSNAQFGRVIGAVVHAETREPSDVFTAETRIRAVDGSAYVETPLADDKVHVGVAGLVSYMRPLLKAFAPEYNIDYRDFQTRIAWDATPRDRLTVLGLGSYDYASQYDANEERVLFASELYRVDLRWDHVFEEKTRLRAAVTVGYDRSRLVGRRFVGDRSLAARARYSTAVTDALELRLGGDVRSDTYRADLPNPAALTRADYEESARVLGDRTDVEGGVWAFAIYRPTSRLELHMGVRADGYDSQDRTEPALEPRTAVAWSLLRWLRVRTEHGVAHQPPAYSLPIPALSVGGLPGGLQESFQSSASTEVSLPLSVVWTTTAFRNAYTNLSDFILLQSDFPLKPTAPESGVTVGTEMSMRRPVKDRWGMQVSYTLSRTTRTRPAGAVTLGRYDRAHVLNVALMLDLGRGWNLGARVLYYTGIPEAPDNLDGPRLPDFYRIDARLAKRWTFGKSGYVGVVLEGLNITGSTETIGVTCSDGPCRPRKLGALALPSVGIEGGL